MTRVLVHGNPETKDVWDPLVDALEKLGETDIVRLSPPGFGSPVPEGFGGTREDHKTWLIAELEKFQKPVDLLGHDWGAGHTYGVAASRPDLLRSYTADCAGLVHPDYDWHPAAQVWQTADEGEKSIADIIALNGDQLVELFGVPSKLAPTMAANLDATMGDAILKIYRSATQPEMKNLGAKLSAAERRPALLIHATNDPFVPPEMVFEVAKMVDGEILTLEGLMHWWMWEDPKQAAEGIKAFWDSVN